MFDDPDASRRNRGLSHRTGASGYVLLAAGLLGLTLVAMTWMPESDLGRARQLPILVIGTGASLGCIIAGVWSLSRGPRKS